MDMLRLYARTLKVVEPIAEANQHKVSSYLLCPKKFQGLRGLHGQNNEGQPASSDGYEPHSSHSNLEGLRLPVSMCTVRNEESERDLAE